MPKHKKSSTSKFLIGAGVAAAVAAGVVGYLTQTKRGKLLAKKGKLHASELSKKVAMRAEKMKTQTKAKYDELVDDVVAEYQKKSKMTKQTATELAAELKKEWNTIRKELNK